MHLVHLWQCTCCSENFTTSQYNIQEIPCFFFVYIFEYSKHEVLLCLIKVQKCTACSDNKGILGVNMGRFVQ